MYRRIVFASAQAVSFEDASEALAELGELKLLPKRVWRAAKRIGEERAKECREAAERYQQLPLPARQQSPTGQAPQVACAMMDGGRYQERDRLAEVETAAAESSERTADAPHESLWREFKAGTLLSMTSKVSTQDPCPELPASFADPANMREIARQIKGFTSESAVSVQDAGQERGGDQRRCGSLWSAAGRRGL
jgi:hypothetical protein